jgi:hypothetical protein
MVASAIARLCYVWKTARDDAYPVTSLPIVICSQIQIYLITLDWVFTALSFLIQQPSGYMSSAMFSVKPKVDNVISPSRFTSESLEDLVPSLYPLNRTKVQCETSANVKDEDQLNDSGRILKTTEVQVTSG